MGYIPIIRSFNKNDFSHKVRNYRKKNMRKEFLISDSFYFCYAGKCEVYITLKDNKYLLIVDGVHIVEDIYCFSPNHNHKYKFDSLYYAILGFNLVIKILTSNIDWYNPDMFEKDVYDEITIRHGR